MAVRLLGNRMIVNESCPFSDKHLNYGWILFERLIICSLVHRSEGLSEVFIEFTVPPEIITSMTESEIFMRAIVSGTNL